MSKISSSGARKELREAIAELKAMGLRIPLDRVFKRELPLCGARCRDGHACRARAAWDWWHEGPRNGRCRMHGGRSTGPRTQEGRDRISTGMKKMWAERREERRASISAGMRRYWEWLRAELDELDKTP
jgi:hypothetical protein